MAEGYVNTVPRLIVGDPGNEQEVSLYPADGRITISGSLFNTALMASAIGNAPSINQVLHRHSTAAGPTIFSARSRSADATHAVVQVNDILFQLSALGHDGTDYEPAASIQMEVDATPGNDDMPGRIRFFTTADGARTITERFRISNFGGWGIGGANFGTQGQRVTSQGGAAAPVWESDGLAAIVANASTTNSANNNAIATYTAPAGTLLVGDVYRACGDFTFANIASGGPTLTFELLIGGTVVNTFVVAAVASAATFHGRVVAEFTVRSIGAGGTVMTALHVAGFGLTLAAAYGGGSNVDTATDAVDTTVSRVLELRARMTTAVAATSLTFSQGYWERPVRL